jgi:biotin transporter BioY
VLSAAAGNLLILSVGAVWLGILTHASLSAVLAQSVFPFLPGDALKVVGAAALASGWLRVKRRGWGS